MVYIRNDTIPLFRGAECILHPVPYDEHGICRRLCCPTVPEYPQPTALSRTCHTHPEYCLIHPAIRATAKRTMRILLHLVHSSGVAPRNVSLIRTAPRTCSRVRFLPTWELGVYTGNRRNTYDNGGNASTSSK